MEVSAAVAAVLAAAVPREVGNMHELGKKFLTKEEQNKVTEAVKQAELLTSGEIVPMIVSHSYDYPKARLAGALLFSLPATFVLTQLLALLFWLNADNVYVFFSFFAPLFTAFYFLTGRYPVIAKFLISREEMEKEVEEEAVKSFFSEKLYTTRDNNGVLLFISVFEKKAWILVDHGVEKKINQKIWDEMVNELTAKIARNEHCEALCNTIEQIGAVLQQNFPYKKDDTDELHNLIVK